MRAAAVVTDRVRPGVLALHHGAWAETTEAGEREDGGVRLDCRHGAANVLVPDPAHLGLEPRQQRRSLRREARAPLTARP